MSQNLDEIFTRAASSNLTATAVEFIPRTGSSSSTNRNSNSIDMDNNRYDNRNQRYYDRRYQNYDNNSYYNRDRNSQSQSSSSSNSYAVKSTPKVRDRRTESDNTYSGSSGYYSNGPSYPRYDNSKRYPPEQKNNNRNNHFKKRDYDDEDDEEYDDRYQQNSRYAVYENRNHRSNYSSNFSKSNVTNGSVNGNKKKSTICQRERLTEQLNDGILECLVCCERIKQREPVWSCSNCYHVLHLYCITKWAKSSKNDNNNWRCPACQNESVQIPEKYMCFCNKTRLQTEWNRNDTAHSCGEVCGKSKENPTPWFICEHKCNLLCHPGPCPSCTIQVTRECGCGRTTRTVQCSFKTPILCGKVCDRLLNCGVHRCLKTCHFGECEPCDMKTEIACFCNKSKKELICGSQEQENFTCGEKCDKTLACDNHKCDLICHQEECGLCPRSPIVVNSCCCGKTPLTENTRQSCLDPMPTCEQICGKRLHCGTINKPHFCESKCHDGDCTPCKKSALVKCRCGGKEMSIPCSKIDKDTGFQCQKKCNKKRSCGKHKCNQLCCIDVDHICPQRCSGTLSCGKHRCDILCHRGKCGRCLQSSFEELYCHCGHSVIYPPVPCGTKPPACDQPCQRQHDCEHPPLHVCHSDRACPPCIVFTDKLCYGGHELRKTIPCYQKEFSCGLPCGQPLPCGFHKCLVPCHAGDCLTASKKCTQPCTKPRDLCGHPCNAPCHKGYCPDTPCKEMVKVTCACGNLVADHNCYEHADDYRRIVSATLAAKMNELQLENSVNIHDISDKINAEKVNLRTLECADECKLIMRNRRLALALQIQNPDLSAKLTPRFSDFMKGWAKKDPNFCRHVHDKLTALVKLAKESKQKSRSFSFEVMNKEKRQFVHEYCAHFGCESEAYDAEPKRNVVAIAVKGRCWLPAYSVLEVLQRESGQRKVPLPVLNNKKSKYENDTSNGMPPTIILPVLPSASSNSRFNYFGD
ncbi:protein shuttle craft [Planococcus citri]|uniref:protein shuttle craft n=1 Tax=Planococcus citri TaxID=170843 RepID=UPI0031F99431